MRNGSPGRATPAAIQAATPSTSVWNAAAPEVPAKSGSLMSGRGVLNSSWYEPGCHRVTRAHRRSTGHYGRTRVDEAAKVRDLNRHLRCDAPLDADVHPRSAAPRSGNQLGCAPWFWHRDGAHRNAG